MKRSLSGDADDLASSAKRERRESTASMLSIDGSRDANIDWLHQSQCHDYDEQVKRRCPGSAVRDEARHVEASAAMDVREVYTPRVSSERTPELAVDAVGADASSTATTPARCPIPTFSLFRPKQHRKVLIVVRHGESAFNASVRSGVAWKEPKIYDPHLTPTGCQQALRLRGELARELTSNRHLSMHRHDAILWVCSPLQRALQTLLLGCPHLPPFRLDADRAFGGEHLRREVARVFEVARKAHGDGAAPPLPNIRVVSHIAERLMTSGDIGTPSSALQAQFAPMAHCMDLPDERWWYGEDENCQTRESFGRKEPDAHFKSRLAAAQTFIERRPEPVIVLVGHSVFWKAFFKMDTSLRNCEFKVMHY